MKQKVLEILDRATYIPVIATECYSDNPIEQRHFRRTGFGAGQKLIMVTRIPDGKSHYASYRWDNGSRTMQVAHEYIEKHFEVLQPGDIVDVEYILGETKTKKQKPRNKAIARIRRRCLCKELKTYRWGLRYGFR